MRTKLIGKKLLVNPLHETEISVRTGFKEEKIFNGVLLTKSSFGSDGEPKEIELTRKELIELGRLVSEYLDEEGVIK